MYSDRFNNTLLSQGCVPETAPSVRIVDRMYILSIGGRVKVDLSHCLGPPQESISGCILLITSSICMWEETVCVSPIPNFPVSTPESVFCA